MHFYQYKQFWLFFLVCCCYGYSFYVTTTYSYKRDWQQQHTVTLDTVKTNSTKPFFRENYVAPDLQVRKNHVSSVSFLDKDTTICAWYAGSEEGAKDVAIYYSTYNNNVWSPVKRIVDVNTYQQEHRRYVRKIGNAVIFKDNHKNLWLFYSSVSVGGWSMSTLNYKVSKNNGETWSPSKKLLLSPFFNFSSNVKNKPILLENGSFLLPIYSELVGKFSYILWGYLENNELKYQIRRITFDKSALQPTLIHQQGQNIIAYFRNRYKKSKLYTKSTDMGITWTDIGDSSLPNPNSGFDMVRITSNNYLGIINNSPFERDNLVIIKTQNSGKKWNVLHYLETPIREENDQRFQLLGKKEHYYQYPSIVYNNGIYHITYTCFNKIKHVTFNDLWLEEIQKN